MKRTAYTVAIALACALFALPASAIDYYREGNDAYMAGNFDLARERYERALAENARDANLYYNLGNAYYRLKDIGRARLNYERALRANDMHGDARANMAHIRETLGERDEEAHPLLSVFFAPYYSFSLNVLAIAALGLFSALVFAFGAFFVIPNEYVRKALVWTAAALGALTLYFGAQMVVKYRIMYYNNEAIVIATETSAHSGAGEQYEPVFPLTAGMKVQIVETENAWIRIALSSGLSGWMRAGDLERI